MPDSRGYYSDEEIDANTPEGRRKAATEAATGAKPPSPLDVDPATGYPKGQYFTSGPMADYSGFRKAAIAGTQFLEGLPALPMAGARLAWNLAQQEFPSIGPPPARLSPTGPGGYDQYIVPKGLTPSTPGEREVAAAFRSGGAAFPFEGPVGAAITGLGSGIAQGEREAGMPEWLATGTDILGGLGGAARRLGSPQAPVVQAARRGYALGGGAPLAAVSPAAARAGGSIEGGILGTMFGEPIAQMVGARYGPGAALATNLVFGTGGYLLGGGRLPTSANAYRVASRLLGGYVIGDINANAPSPGVGGPLPNTNQLYPWPETDTTGAEAGPVMPMAPLAPQ